MTTLLDHGVQLSAALDPHRRDAYKKAIHAALTECSSSPSIAFVGFQASTLIDATGHHASRIVVVENDPTLLDALRDGLATSGTKNVELIDADPTTVALEKKVDIVVIAHTSVWFAEGPSAAILTNAQANVVKTDGVMIPRRFVHLFALACAPTNAGGIALRVPRYARPGEPVPTLSESKHWSTNDLATQTLRTSVEDTIIVKPLLSGTLTGIRISTAVELADNTIHSAGHSGFDSVFVPLREDVPVKADTPVEVFIRFGFGNGLDDIRASGRILAEDVTPSWDHFDAPAVQTFRDNIIALVKSLDGTGRGSDLDKVVSYTIDPHGDVTRLTALFWTVDEEFRKPIRDIVEAFRKDAASLGTPPNDDIVYEIMLSTYRTIRA